MAFSGNYTCTSFKVGLMDGSFDFSTQQFYIALYTNAVGILASLISKTLLYVVTYDEP